MTCIVSPLEYKSKKAFKEAVLANSAAVFIEDPSIVAPFSGRLRFHPAITTDLGITVTNHPKRSWFARVYMRNGELRVD